MGLITYLATFLFGGILHPYEFGCVAAGVLYYLCIPAGYLILTIFSLANMHVVAWGTREVRKSTFFKYSCFLL